MERRVLQPAEPDFPEDVRGAARGRRGLAAARACPRRARSTSGQFWLLFGRYFKVKVRDVGGTAIMLLQAPIIGVLFALVFGGQRDAIPYWCLGRAAGARPASGGGIEREHHRRAEEHAARPPTTRCAVFFLVVAAVWFGTSNAAREIVSERAIYLRERMVNLRLFNYVFSKFVLLSFFCVIQCTVLLAIVFFALGLQRRPPGVRASTCAR